MSQTDWEVNSCAGVGTDQWQRKIGDQPASFIWKGAWVISTTYLVNEVVENDGSAFIVVVGHVADANNEPGVGAGWTNVWELFVAGGAGVAWKGPWSSITPYLEFDAVEYLGSAWVAVIANTNVIPTVASAEWDLVAAAGTDGQTFVWKSTWTPGGNYDLQDAVERNGTSYTSLTDGNIGNDPELTLGSFWDVMALKGTDGANGSDGVDGNDGADGISFIWQDSWSSIVTYALNDVVEDNGSSYISLQDSNLNMSPAATLGVWWDLMAAKGTDGIGAGDMLASVYDINLNNIVDRAEAVDDGGGNSATALEIANAVADAHNHANKATLDLITDAGSGNIITTAERNNLHTHSNKAILDAIGDAGSGNIITALERSKLAAIEDSATADQVASEVPFTPAGNLLAIQVQAALEELDTNKSETDHVHNPFTQTVDGFVPAPVTAPAGEVLDDSGAWVPLPAAGATELDDLSDVTVTVPITGEVLRFNGTLWVDAVLNAGDVANAAAGDIVATDVQAAINELDTEKAPIVHVHAVFSADTPGFVPDPGPTPGTALFLREDSVFAALPPSGASVLNDLTDVTDTTPSLNDILRNNGAGQYVNVPLIAATVVFSATGNISSGDVQAAIEELDTEKAPIGHVGAGGLVEHPIFTSIAAGFAPLTGAPANNFLRDDGTWAAPPTGAVTSVFGRTGAVIAVEGDYDLNLLADVNLITTPPVTDDILAFDGSLWVPAVRVDLNSAQTLTNKTIVQPRLTLEQSNNPTPTANGEIWWRANTNQIKVGDGATTLTFSDDSALPTLPIGTADIADDAITNAKLANMSANTIKGSLAGGDPIDLTANQGSTLLDTATDPFLRTSASPVAHTHLLADITDSGALAALNQVDTAEIVDDAVTLAKMEVGTIGNLISYGAGGNPEAVATGNDTEVLTSNGVGNAPTFQAPTGGGSGHVIEDEGTPLTARAALNFIGGPVVASDNAGANATDITVSFGSLDDLTDVTLTAPVVGHMLVSDGGANWANVLHRATGGVSEHPVFTGTVEGFVPAPAPATGTAFLRDDGAWIVPAGAGDVSGPGVPVVDNAFVLWDGISGTIIKETGTQIQTAQIADDAVTFGKIQNVVADNVFLGNVAGIGGIVAELDANAGSTLLDGATDPFLRTSLFTGHQHVLADITDSGTLAGLNSVGTNEINNNAVTNPKLANMDQNTIKGNDLVSGDPKDLTANEASNILDTATDPFLRSSLGGASDLDALSDVTITTPSADQVLVNNGAGQFVNTQVPTGGIADDAVTFAKMQAITSLAVIGNATQISANPTAIQAVSDGQVLRRAGTALGFGQIVAAGIATNAVESDKILADAVTTVKILDANVTAAKIPDGELTNAKLADMLTNTFKGRTTPLTGVPEDLTAVQASVVLETDPDPFNRSSVFNAHEGAGGTARHPVFSNGVEGFVPDPGVPSGGAFLRDDGVWFTPPGSGDVVGPAGAVDNGFALFDGATGKLIKDGGTTIATAQIADNAVDNAKLADMAANTFKANAGPLDDPEDLAVAGFPTQPAIASTFAVGFHTDGSLAKFDLTDIPIPTTALDDLTDVTVVTPGLGQVLVSDAGGLFTNQTLDDAEVNNTSSVAGANVDDALNTLDSGKSNTGHTHLLANITDFNTLHGGQGGGVHADVVAGGADGFMLGTDKSKLDGIEDNATADQTDAQIKTAYENNANTNEFSDAEQTKLAGAAELAADQTFTAGQRKQVTSITNFGDAWNLNSSNDFNVTNALTGTPSLQTPNVGNLASGEAQAGELTLTVTSGTPGFAVGWDFPGGTAPDLSTAGDYTLYYRVFNVGAGPVFRIVGLEAWS